VTQEITSSTPEDSLVPKPATLRYKVWGIGYLILLTAMSPAMPYAQEISNHQVLPWIEAFHKGNFAWAVQPRDLLVTHWTLQALACNLLLMLFSIVETFLRGRKTSFDIGAALAFGAAAVVNVALFFMVFTSLEFLYVTFGFALFYVLFDSVGLAVSSKQEPEMRNSFLYSLSFVDAPTLLVSTAFVVPSLLLHQHYPPGFSDGIGAAILLFSGCAWTATMVLFVSKTVDG
jgi:hypothetical protein